MSILVSPSLPIYLLPALSSFNHTPYSKQLRFRPLFTGINSSFSFPFSSPSTGLLKASPLRSVTPELLIGNSGGRVTPGAPSSSACFLCLGLSLAPPVLLERLDTRRALEGGRGGRGDERATPLVVVLACTNVKIKRGMRSGRDGRGKSGAMQRMEETGGAEGRGNIGKEVIGATEVDHIVYSTRLTKPAQDCGLPEKNPSSGTE